MSAVTFFESMTAAMVLHGNCYAEIKWGGDGQPKQLELRHPETVFVEVIDDDIAYRVSNPNSVLLPENMLHVPGIGGDGIQGWSVISYAQQSLGAALAGLRRLG